MPPAPKAPSADGPASGGLEQEVERLANPGRSLFEGTSPQLAGRHHGSALSLVAGIVGGFGAALGVSLVAIVRVIGGNVAEDMPGVVAIAAAIIALSAVLSAVRGYVRSPAKRQPTASRRPVDRA